jgi:hypothetical protein
MQCTEANSKEEWKITGNVITERMLLEKAGENFVEL